MLLDSYLNLVLKKPWLSIAGIVLISGFFAWFSQDFKLDASADALVVEGDVDLEFSRQMNERYGSRDLIFVSFKPAVELFSESSLDALRALRDELLNIPRVESIDSILDVPLFKVADVALSEIADNIVTLTTDNVNLDAARDDLASSEAYRNVLLSEDASIAALIVNFATNLEVRKLVNRRTELRNLQTQRQLNDADQDELKLVSQQYSVQSAIAAENLHEDISAIREILDRYRLDAEIVMGGVPMIADDLITFVKKDIINFGAAILAFIIFTLTYLFRELRYVLIPLLCCSVTIVTVIGLLGFLDWRVTVISSNFILILLIITMSLTVHLMVRYRELETARPEEDHQSRLAATLRSMLKPCAYTSLTTIVAFGSLVVSGIPPIIDFGWMMGIGVLTAFSITFVLFPAVLSLLKKSKSAAHSSSLDLTPVLARFTNNHGGKIIVFSVLLLLFSIAGMSRLRVENSFINYFDESTEIYQGMVFIDQNLGGTTPLDVIIDLSLADGRADSKWEDELWAEEEWDDEEDGIDENAYWFTSDKMQEIIDIHDYLDELPQTGKVLSLGTLIKLAQELNGNEPLDSIELAVLYTRLPEDYKEALLRPYVSVENDQIRFSIRVRESDPNLVRSDLLSTIRNDLMGKFGFQDEQIHLTGMLVLYNNMLQTLFDSQILTLGLVLAIILLMFTVLFSSLKLAVIGIIPNIIAASSVLGIMGWLNIPLDMMTITIAAISVGIGVDNTIHYIHRFKDQYPQHQDYRKTMVYCHSSIGKAMYYTSFTIVVGFSILVFSNFIPSIYFGLLTSLAMIIALTGALTLLPQLLILFKPLK